jgi:Family of unknown function (DUF6364)
MKERLNLTIDGALLEAMKTYAASKEMSVSELVESYFRSVTKPVQRNNILDLVEGLKKPDFEAMGSGDEVEKGAAPGMKEARETAAAGMKEGGDYGF